MRTPFSSRSHQATIMSARRRTILVFSLLPEGGVERLSFRAPAPPGAVCIKAGSAYRDQWRLCDESWLIPRYRH